MKTYFVAYNVGLSLVTTIVYAKNRHEAISEIKRDGDNGIQIINILEHKN